MRDQKPQHPAIVPLAAHRREKVGGTFSSSRTRLGSLLTNLRLANLGQVLPESLLDTFRIVPAKEMELVS